MNNTFNWEGSYEYYHQKPHSDDGTTRLKLAITKNGDSYNVTYTTSTMRRDVYTAHAVSKGNTLEVIVDSKDPADGPYQKGDKLFTLEPSKENDGSIHLVQSGGYDVVLSRK